LKAYFSLIKLLIFDKTHFRFAIGVWLGLSFSIAVILSTIGLMDGFDKTLRGALRKSHGDLYAYGRSGFFTFSKADVDAAKKRGVKAISRYIQSEAFLIHRGLSKGVSVRGVEEKSFQKLTTLDFSLEKNSVAIGKVLALELNIKIGDTIVLALAKGNRNVSSLPLLTRFKVSSFVHHGHYQKDLRFIYIKKSELAKILKVENLINVVALKVHDKNDQDIDDAIKETHILLEDYFGGDFRIIPYWHEYQYLLRAVKYQKVMIALILQIIVVVSIFNVFAFITFLNTKKAQDIFLFQALGMSKANLTVTWCWMVFLVWFVSCFTSIFMTMFFEYLLGSLSIFELPGNVYGLSRIGLDLHLDDYVMVFLSSLLWLGLIICFSLWKIHKEPILKGLRKEFA